MCFMALYVTVKDLVFNVRKLITWESSFSADNYPHICKDLQGKSSYLPASLKKNKK